MGRDGTEPVVWRLSEADSEEAGALLARTTVDSPLFAAALPDRARLAALSPGLCAANVRYGCRVGEAWAVGPEPRRLAGVAYWIVMPEDDVAEASAADLCYDAIRAAWGGTLDYVVAAEDDGVAAIPGLPPRWRYLQMIGVAPEQQGRGLGTTLLRRLVADAAAAGVPMGLVTDRAVNRPLYRRVGFEEVWAGATRDGQVPLWSFRTP